MTTDAALTPAAPATIDTAGVSRVVLTGLWADAALVMAASAWNGGRAAQALGDPFWWGFMLGIAVDVGLATALAGDRSLYQLGRREPWGRAVRIVTAIMSLGLNCAYPIWAGQVGLVLFHAFLPVLLVLLSEYAQSLTLHFNTIAAEQVAAVKAERDAQHTADQAAADSAAEAARIRHERDTAQADAARLQRVMTQAQADSERRISQLTADLERQTAATQTATEQLAAAQTAPPPPSPTPTRPTPKQPADRETRRQWVRDQRAHGATPTGADVDKRFGPPRNGAAVIREVLAEERNRLKLVGGRSQL